MPLIDVDSMPRETIFGATGVLEVIQNCRTILLTRKGTVPLDRNFGISMDFLDSPISGVRAKAEQEIFLAFRKYEPRAVISEIIWDTDILSGKVNPNVKIQVVL